MISLRLRWIREHNRIYTFILKILNIVQPGPVVYLFHDIVESENDVKSQFGLSLKSFETFIASLIISGKKALSYEEIKHVVNNQLVTKDGFYISFDDCNESVFTKAYPVLKKYNIPFVIFITKELIDKTNYLTRDQILNLSEDPLCTIGSHAVHHKMFRYLNNDEICNELKDSREYLQQLTGQSVDSFAFPYGRLVEVSGSAIQQIRQSEYSFSFSAISGNLRLRWFTSKFFLPRVNVSEKVVSEFLKSSISFVR